MLHSPGPCPPIDTAAKRSKQERLGDLAIKGGRWAGGRSLTCDQTLAGISGGSGVDAIRGIRNLVSSVFDGDGVSAGQVGKVRHRVSSVPVVPNVGFLWLPLWILLVAHKHNAVVGPAPS